MMENNFEKMKLNGEEVKEDEGQIMMKIKACLPCGMHLLKTQVAGHRMDLKKKTFGIICESEEIILKSGDKKHLRDREIDFYEKVKNSDDPVYKSLSKLIPKYCGIRELCLFNETVQFLALGNTTSGMSEPCVIDIKIGKRTWDPLAGANKRASEDKKYAESKSAYGFSITGFRMIDVMTKCLKVFDKNDGKNLNSETVVEALKTFLNIAPDRPPCRNLLIMLLTSLWKILAFFRTQKLLRFYSSSVLIVYDASRLRHALRTNHQNEIEKRYDYSNIPTNYPSWSSSANMKVDKKQLKKSSSSHNFNAHEKDNRILTNKSKCLEMNGFDKKVIHTLCRTHSVENNYDSEMIKMKQDYTYVLSELMKPSKPYPDWVRVTMIDFAHVYPAEDNSVDKNYLDGIENLIKILETFLDNCQN